MPCATAALLLVQPIPAMRNCMADDVFRHACFAIPNASNETPRPSLQPRAVQALRVSPT